MALALPFLFAIARFAGQPVHLPGRALGIIIAFASNYLVTIRTAARSLLAAAGAPPEALDPLIRGVMDNDFELTGPIERGDWETVERHLAVIRAERPELEELYLALANSTADIAGRELPSDSLSLGVGGPS